MSRTPTLAQWYTEHRSDYEAAKASEFRRRRTGLAPMGASADYHYRSQADFLKLQEFAYDVVRNDMVVGAGIRRLVKNVIQTGFSLDPDTGDAEADDLVEELWNEWAEDKFACHAGQTLDWHQIERLAYQSQVTAGDCFGLPLAEGTLETIESYRCRTPSNTKKNCVHGVLLDERSRPLQYWFTKADIAAGVSVQRVGDVQPIDVRDEDGQPQVFHNFDPQRFSQHRGVTALAPCLTAVGIHDDIEFAELVKRQIASCVGFMREIQSNQGAPPLPGSIGETEQRVSSAGVNRFLQHLYPGMEVVGKPGEMLKFFTPQMQGADFITHAHLILTFISINLDIPLAVLLLDPSNTNFSGWRGAIDQARISWKDSQENQISTWHRPVTRWKIRQWLTADLYDADVRCLRLRQIVANPARKCDPFQHQWNPPSWTYIEPLKDATADTLQQEKLLQSPRRIQARKGQQWQQVARETVEDNTFAIRLAKTSAAEINAEFPADTNPVHWREVLTLTSTEKLSIAIGNDAATGNSDAGHP